MNWKRFLVAMFAALLLLPSVIMAQSIVTGAINGTVTDPSGAVIAGAAITLTSTATGESLTAESNASGGYSFGLVKPGAYTLAVTKSGFKTTTQAVQVALGETLVFNAKLELGSGSITVEVTGQGALLQTENANISTSIETAEIENLPNPGGDLTNIALTAPGVAGNTTGGGYGNFSAFGLPGTANLFTLNGNDYNDPFLNLNNSGASNLLLGSNEIQEVSVISNAYTGQYGRQAGAQIDYATKSGGNAFHGDAVYYYNSAGLNSDDFFNGYEREVNNQWAASLGGPVIKNKVFFFANTEGLRYTLASGAGEIFYPTAAFESFVLANVATLPTASTATPFYENIFSLYNASKGYAAAIANPQANSCGLLTGAPGLGTNACTGGVFQTSPNGNTEWLVSGRVDWDINENNKVFGRTKFDRGTQPTYTDPVSPIFNIHSIQPQDEGQLNYTHIFSPNIVNNIVGSVLWYSAIFQSPDLSAATAAFPGLFSLTDIPLACLGEGCGDDTGFSIFPQGRNVTQWGIVDDLSITRGNHSFKMGVNFRRDDVSDYTASEGLIPAASLNSVDFANDVLNPGAVSSGDSVTQAFALHARQPIAFYSVGLYFQDEYRVNSRLKLTLALRADRNSSGVCQSDCGSAPPIPFQDQSHNAALPFDTITNPGSHAILPGVERIVFQPRVGVAWTPFGDKTVIRAGVGQFSDLYPGTILDRFTTNFPQDTAFTYNASGSNFAFTDPGSAALGVVACNASFQSAYHSGGNLADFNTTPGCAGQTPGLASVGKLLNPKYTEWNVEIQRTIGARTVVSANYVGNRGYDGLLINPYLNTFAPDGFAGLPTSPTDQRVGNVSDLTNNNTSNYNGITLSVQENMWHGFMGRFNYTYSHALDDVSNGGILPFAAFIPQVTTQLNPLCLRCNNYSNADYDLRHNITANYLYQMPFHSENRLVDAALGGWTVSGTIYYHTGFPFSLEDAGDFNSEIAGNFGAGGVVLAQPITPVQNSCTSPNVQCYSLAQFAGQQNPALTGPCNPCSNPAPTGYGNFRRNTYRGPNYFNTDFSLRKSFRLTERMALQLGANAYNVLNHPNFQVPDNTTAFGPSFGTITSTVSPPTTPYGSFAGSLAANRILQLIAKFTF
ncbi:MAG: carboxypeptidase-like regulatory domain-containing protein [Candidatus Acidiferrales bacterium]